MKMVSLWKSKTYLKNDASPISQSYVFKKVLIFPKWAVNYQNWNSEKNSDARPIADRNRVAWF